jgi:hypothetical protein
MSRTLVVVEMVASKDSAGETSIALRFHPPVIVKNQLQLPGEMATTMGLLFQPDFSPTDIAVRYNIMPLNIAIHNRRDPCGVCPASTLMFCHVL